MEYRIEKDLEELKQTFGHTEDLMIRQFSLTDKFKRQVAVVYIDGLVDTAIISQHIIRPLTEQTNNMNVLDSLTEISDLISTSETKIVLKKEEIVNQILSGSTCVLVNGFEGAVLADSEGGEQRGVEDAILERTTRGPHEGFIEALDSNIGLIRQHLNQSKLIFEKYEIGTVSKNIVMVCFIEDKVKPTVLQEVRARIEKIDIDAVLESGYVEQLIEDNPLSPFPSMKVTERPDVVAGNLLEARVVILVDGSPFALILPASVNSMMQSSDDYYERYPQVILMRGTRWIALVIGLLLPAFYVAVTTYNQELIPTRLLFTIAANREGIPLPAVMEALFMEVAFEVLREAGLRLPQQIGPAISIVGVLVIGEAAVNAGIISSIMVVIVGMTALSTFAIPQYSFANSIRFLRFPIIILAGTFGLFGIGIGLFAILTHLLGERSFGNPMMDPFSPLTLESVSDGVVRLPWKTKFSSPIKKLKGFF